MVSLKLYLKPRRQAGIIIIILFLRKLVTVEVTSQELKAPQLVSDSLVLVNCMMLGKFLTSVSSFGKWVNPLYMIIQVLTKLVICFIKNLNIYGIDLIL